jgi:hypothetical protein
MLSIGLWKFYINITITVLDIIRRHLFLFKTQRNFIGLSVPHKKHMTSPLRAQQLMLSIGLWRSNINITITILYIFLSLF